MRWSDGRRSDNVEDRRGMGAPTMAGGVGLVGILLAIAVALLGGTLSWCCSSSPRPAVRRRR